MRPEPVRDVRGKEIEMEIDTEPTLQTASSIAASKSAPGGIPGNLQKETTTMSNDTTDGAPHCRA
jgi:hypothetical protein